MLNQRQPRGSHLPLTLLIAMGLIAGASPWPEANAADSKEGDKAGKAAKAGKKLAVRFSLKGVIAEQDNPEDPFMLMTGDSATTGVRLLKKKFESAAKDPSVGSVLLAFDTPLISWTHAEILRDGIKALRKSGKTVIAHADYFSTPHYLLAAAADKVYLSREGILLLNGLTGKQYFLKGMLDKIGLAADMHHMGSHKGAAEPLTRVGPSKELQEMMDWILDDRYDHLCTEIGRLRGKDKVKGKEWVDGGPYSSAQALKAGLVDGIKSRLEVIAEAKTVAGLTASDRLTTNFGKKAQKPAFDFSNPFAIFKIFADLTKPKVKEAGKPAVGLIYALGTIQSGKGDDGGMGSGGIYSLATIAHIEKARKDPGIRAVVLRIDSPGGSALASEAIYEALLELKKVKPLIVSIGSVGASGGYYIAAPAEKIFVHPTSTVGSIGVVGGKIVMKGLYDWLGITTHTYKRGGPRATLFDESTPFSPEEKAWFMSNMKDVYDRFVEIVKNGRGEKLKDFESKIAGGKVFTGRQALKNGLADSLGGLKEALDFAATQSKLANGKEKYEIRVVNPPGSMSQKILDMMSGKKGEESEITEPNDVHHRIGLNFLRKSMLLNSKGNSSRIFEALEVLGRLDPVAAARLEGQLQALEVMARERVMMRMPFDLTFTP